MRRLHTIAVGIALTITGNASEARLMTAEDLATLHDIDSLSVSANGSHFAILVRQADLAANDYQSTWLIGSAEGDAKDRKLTQVGSGGEVRMTVGPDGQSGGDLAGSPGRWSPDGKWIAYTLKRVGEVQVWRSHIDGRIQQQVTHSEADVRDFAWSDDGRTLYFKIGSPRAALHARDETGRRNGFQLNELQWYTDMVHHGKPERPLETDLTVWVADIDTGREQPATPQQREEYARAESRDYDRFLAGGVEQHVTTSGAIMPPVARQDGAVAWAARTDPLDKGYYPHARLMAALPGTGNTPIACTAPVCTSQGFRKIWWSHDGAQIIFLQVEGSNQSDTGLYTWAPLSGKVVELLRSPDDWILECGKGVGRMICLRETSTQPRHVAAIDTTSGAISVLADVNPQLKKVQLAHIERFEWTVPRANGGLEYPDRARGYILYPPNFNPKRKYPVIICPYLAAGFKRGDVGDEHPMFVYAANGFVVINSEFPMPWGSFGSDDNATLLRKQYSLEHGFPHLTVLMQSTFRALDKVAERGFVDLNRVGIGGVSHGTFVPLFMVQNSDRIAAVSVASTGWNQAEYYFSTRYGRELFAKEGGSGDVWPEDSDYWAHIDIADHVKGIDAPLLFHFADRELFAAPRLMRRLDDAQKPYDAYIFPDEYHFKWQPAHRLAIYRRNLDWFRFWLQDYEDPSSAKAEQYTRWRKLRELQCHNRCSLHSYCRTTKSPPASPIPKSQAPKATPEARARDKRQAAVP